MIQGDIINMIAGWIQAARDAGKTYVQLKWQSPELQLYAYPNEKITKEDVSFLYHKIDIPDLKLRDVGKRVTGDMPCNDPCDPLELAKTLFNELVATG